MTDYCECGCGQEIVQDPKRSYRKKRFVLGHQSKFRDYSTQCVKPPDDWDVPSGLCACGCGQKTKIAKSTRAIHDQYAGFPLRFVHGHNPRGKKGAEAHRWTGGRHLTRWGYWRVHRPDHPEAGSGGYVMEHRVIWEEVNGRRLRPNEDVHHIDGDRGNNDPANLVALTKTQHYAVHSDSVQTRAKRSAGQTASYERDPDLANKRSETQRKVWARRKAVTA